MSEISKDKERIMSVVRSRLINANEKGRIRIAKTTINKLMKEIFGNFDDLAKFNDMDLIKEEIESNIKYLRSKGFIRGGFARLDNLIDCILFKIDHPNYVNKERNRFELPTINS